MNKKTKVRKGCLLCLSFARNYAFYKAAFNEDWTHFVGGMPSLSNQFWNVTTGNYIDVAVMEWCKLFGNERQEKFHWKSVVKNKALYKTQLLDMFEEGDPEWLGYREDMLIYRDKFVAHLDEENQYIIPRLEKALKLVVFHYEYLLQHENEDGFFLGKIPNIQTYFQQHFDMAREVYQKHNAQ